MVWACVAKKDNDWVKSMKWRVPDHEVDQRGLGERLCNKDCPAWILDAIDRSRWRKLIKDG